jgi:hypothetical protein
MKSKLVVLEEASFPGRTIKSISTVFCNRTHHALSFCAFIFAMYRLTRENGQVVDERQLIS